MPSMVYRVGRTHRMYVMGWSSTLLLLFLFFSLTILRRDVCAQSVCPERCLCYLDRQPSTVICSKQGFEQFPEGISDILQHLDLSGNVLREIPSDIVRLTELQYLNLAKNRLSRLPESLEGLDNLERLDLTGNDIRNVASIASLGHLTALKVLYLSGNSIVDLGGLTNGALQALDASNCAITKINNNTFADLPSLTTLSLSGNPLKMVQMPYSKKLKWLDMSNCQINYLSPNSLKGLVELEDLRLSNNPMLVFSTRYETLKHTNLKKLDASRCNLDRPGLHGLPALTHVKFSQNVIRILPDRIFAKNKELVQLSLNGNGLDSLNKSSFAGLQKLQMLDLSTNSLREVHWSTFHENVELRLLNLSYNNFLEFPNLTAAATMLDMTANLIYNFEEDVLLNMPRLKTLNLSNNRLEAIPNNLESSTLTILSLKQNRLVSLSNESFAMMPALEKIDLSGNRLTEGMDPHIFWNNKKLQRLYLDDNPWRCNCHQLHPSYNYLTQPPAKSPTSSLVCQSPSNVSGYSWEVACFDIWSSLDFSSHDKTLGLVLVSLLTLVILFGSIVSLRHAMKMKRQAQMEREELERAEARERLRLLQRRNRQLEENLEDQSEPRIHPMELIGPPSYEEAVHMPRMTHSMDNLDELSGDNVSVSVIGSVDNLRMKKRRPRRTKKRVRSEEDLAKLEERREGRRRRRISVQVDPAAPPSSTGNDRLGSNNNLTRSSRASSVRRFRRRSVSEDGNSSAVMCRPRPQTPITRLKKRRQLTRDDGNSPDDEDSDLQDLSCRQLNAKSSSSMIIQELPKEPRSGRGQHLEESDV